MVRAVVLDFGGVLVEIHGARVRDALAALAPLASRAALRDLHSCDAHFEYERGRISTAEFAREIGRRLGAEIAEDAFLAAWDEVFGPEVDGIGPLLAALGEAVPLHLLSNTNHGHWARMQKYPWMAHFRERFASFEIGARKPDPEVWAIVAGRLGLAPGEILFVDDLAANVAAAREAGMNAEICLNSAAELRRILAKYGLVV